jgi:Phytanoyl-CoA dioxygenase (PhyH)
LFITLDLTMKQVIDFLTRQFQHNHLTFPNQKITDLKMAHNELVESGIAILPNFFDEKLVLKMLSKLDCLSFNSTPEMQHDLSNRPLADKFNDNVKDIFEFSDFFNNSSLINLVKSYISQDAVMYRAFARVKLDTGPVSSFENFYHFDSYKKRIKVFLYLTNVNKFNAPISYMKGSHRVGFWRIKRELEMFCQYKKDTYGYSANQESSYLGCYWPHEAKKMQEQMKFQPITCVGKAGTVIIFDGKGIHMANQLLAQRRAVLVSHWIQPGHHM